MAGAVAQPVRSGSHVRARSSGEGGGGRVRDDESGRRRC